MKKFIWAVSLLSLTFIVVGFILSSHYEVSRSRVIHASAPEIHVFVGDLREWGQWTSWKQNDPGIVIKLGDITTGVGATQRWTSQEGGGSIVFTESSARTGIAYDLSFDGGKHVAKARVDYAADDFGTRVTWSMRGNMNVPLIGAYFALMMDTMIGNMFEQGLDGLAQVVERPDQ